MGFKSALKRSVDASDNSHIMENLSSVRSSLFVPLWSAAATKGGSIRQRVQIDAIGGLVKAGSVTVLNISEFKNSSPGEWKRHKLSFIHACF